MYFDFIEKLSAVCKENVTELQQLGCVGKKREYPLYAVTFDNIVEPHKTVCFSAGIHGDEVAGPFAAVQFIEKYDPKEYPNLRVILFPAANPAGFDSKRRRNNLNRDLNRHFRKPRLSGENNLLYKFLKYENIFFFHALHEDLDEHRFYLYVYGSRDEQIYNEIIGLASNHFPIHKGRRICNDQAKKGIIGTIRDNSLEHRLYQEGTPFAIATETPGRESLEKRVKLNAELMKHIAKFSNEAALLEPEEDQAFGD